MAKKKASARKVELRDLSTRKGDVTGGGFQGGVFGQFGGSVIKKSQ